MLFLLSEVHMKVERVKGVVFQAYCTDKEGKGSTEQVVLHDSGVMY